MKQDEFKVSLDTQSPLLVQLLMASREEPMIYSAKDVCRIFLGNMPESTLMRYVRDGKIERCEHLGSKPYYFTKQQVRKFVFKLEEGMLGLETHPYAPYAADDIAF